MQLSFSANQGGRQRQLSRRQFVQSAAAAVGVATHLASERKLLAGAENFEHGQFTSSGQTIAYSVAGEGPPVVMMHGMTGNRRDFSELRAALLKAGFRVISFDARGHGESDKPPGPDGYGLKLVHDVVRLLDHLRLNRVHLFGYSMGGDVANKLRERHPDRLLSVTIGGAGLGVTQGWAASDFNHLDLAESLKNGHGMKTWLRSPGAVRNGVLSEAEVEEINRQLMDGQDAQALAAIIRSYPRLEIEKPALSKNSVPTLLLVGDRDPEFRSTKELADAMAGVSLLVIKDADHFAAYTRIEFISRTVEFMHTAADPRLFRRNAQLDAVLESTVTPPVVNSVALVGFGDGTPDWIAARGIANPETNEPMTVAHQFRTASVAKTFTAVVVLQLIEQQKLSLDDTIEKWLTDDCRTAGGSIDELQITGGRPHGKQITVRHLLTHTSGIPDYIVEPSQAGRHAGKTLLNVAWDDPHSADAQEFINRDWQPPHGVLEYFFQNKLGMGARFAPGEGFHYSDTNYVLLGAIIQRVTGMALAQNVRKKILEPLGMKSTYYEWRENARVGVLSHHFMLLGGQSHNIVAERLASSAEWAGGGMVSTVADLNRFVRTLFANDPKPLFARKATRDQMLDVSQSGKTLEGLDGYTGSKGITYDAYTFGLSRRKVLGKYECWGHAGFWGVGMFYFPDAQVSIVFSRNQVEGSVSAQLEEFASVLSDLGTLK